MKNTLLRLFALLLVVATTVSCSKDEPKPDYEKLLTAHTWVEANVKFDTEDPYILEIFEGYKLLLEKVEIKFNEDSTYQGDFGNGLWSLTSDNKKVIFDPNTYFKEEWPIHELNHNSLKVSFTRSIIDLEHQVQKVKIYVDLVPKE